MNVLAIGAHPDDLEYSCFGTLAKHIKNGDKVHLLCVTFGAGGALYASNPVRLNRTKESSESALRLGADGLHFLGFTVLEVSEVKPEIIDLIKEEIDRVKPRRVYVNSPYDTNQVHWTVSKSARIAARYVDEILFFETPSTTREFSPTMYVDITDTIGTKLDCLKTHESQLEIRPYLGEEPVRTLAHYRYLKSRLGYSSGQDGYAEAFMVERMITR